MSPAISFLIGPWRSAFRHHTLLVATARVELQRRYAGSILGTLWLFAGPLLLIGIYAAIYLVVFRIRPAEMTEIDYVLYILCGMASFLGFSEALHAGTTSLTANREILLNTVFPAELVPLRAVLVSSTTMVVGIAAVLIAAASLGKLEPVALLAPVIVIAQTMFIAGIGWIFALANLVVRDVQQILVYVTMVLLVASPIAYLPSMLPSALAILIYANPLSYYVIALQHVIVLGTLPPTFILVVGGVLALTGFSLGFLVFTRAKQAIFDYA